PNRQSTYWLRGVIAWPGCPDRSMTGGRDLRPYSPFGLPAGGELSPSGRPRHRGVVVLAALLLSFAVIFVAELGDKTQLVAMMFALRYRWWVVLSAITAATAVVHVLSVAIGYYLGAALPTHLLGFIAGAMFIFFGLWTLRGDSLTDEETSRDRKSVV